MQSLADPGKIEAFLGAHRPIVVTTLFEAGDTVGAWKVTAFLGQGGCGEVYRVTHRELGLTGAMKVLLSEDEASRARLRREARILAEHAHPAFPHFQDYGTASGHDYLVIELLEALPLPKGDRAVARYLLKLCEGVAFLHGLGLVHRDIKPQNVLCRAGSADPVLIDLGLVKVTERAAVPSGVSLSIVDGKALAMGTPRYSAPEQFAGGEISPAADIHALGMLANECFGGRPPRAWSRIIRRSTSSIPSQRYATVAEFVRAIRLRHRVIVMVVVQIALLLLLLASAIQFGWLYARWGLR